MYLDPGSGSVILQVLLGVLLSIAVVLRLFWSRIKTLFRKSSPEQSETEQEDQLRG
jgi:hypothetical protein